MPAELFKPLQVGELDIPGLHALEFSPQANFIITFQKPSKETGNADKNLKVSCKANPLHLQKPIGTAQLNSFYLMPQEQLLDISAMRLMWSLYNTPAGLVQAFRQALIAQATLMLFWGQPALPHSLRCSGKDW